MERSPENVVRTRKRLEKAKSALVARGFGAECFDTIDEARAWLLARLDRSWTLAYGGSRTLIQSGLLEEFRTGGWKLLDRDGPGVLPEQRQDLQAKALAADAFFASANGLAETGQFVNIDCYANRAGAICFGPKRVFLIVGVNKLVATLDEALARARSVGSVTNAIRLKRKTPCAESGACSDCRSADRICAVTTIHEWCPVQGRITLLLVNEELGF